MKILNQTKFELGMLLETPFHFNKELLMIRLKHIIKNFNHSLTRLEASI